MAPSRRRSRMVASCLALALFGTVAIASACKSPIEPCSICNKSTTYCLLTMGSPNWNPQAVCKPMPQACASAPACDCIIKADFPAAPPQCASDSAGLFTLTPGNDC